MRQAPVFAMDSVVHFEIPAKNLKRASEFYTKAFGWQIDKWGEGDYWLLGTTPMGKDGRPSTPGAINGGMGKKGVMAPKSVTVTIGVSDIDAALKNVKKLGGTVTGKKLPVGNMGFSAYFKDTEGNIIGLFQPAGSM